MNSGLYNRKQNSTTFWFFLRMFKKKLRDSYVKDMQEAFERGFKEGRESDEIRRLVKQQWQDGHAQGVYNGLVRVITPSIKSAPSPFIPEFVFKMLVEIRSDILNQKKDINKLKDVLKVALREGTFKVKTLSSQNVALKEIMRIDQDKKRKRDQDVENELAEIEKMRFKKKRKKPVLVKPKSNQT
eukprot:TRINITY_DN1030_c0_g1_i1.p1 TRINITY_DN1030_c0_g1~~TRINITY_DN1030_c0_g1_i1.p1  ORF type:complete len:185 (-),score=34.08 TRINITY_DN1030_c0_g1_i1:151-705(-)